MQRLQLFVKFSFTSCIFSFILFSSPLFLQFFFSVLIYCLFLLSLLSLLFIFLISLFLHFNSPLLLLSSPGSVLFCSTCSSLVQSRFLVSLVCFVTVSPDPVNEPSDQHDITAVQQEDECFGAVAIYFNLYAIICCHARHISSLHSFTVTFPLLNSVPVFF